MQTIEQRKAWLKSNRAKMSEYSRNWRHSVKGREYELNRHLLRTYGITIEEKQRLWDAQKGVCPICAKSLPDIYSRDCQVDHCHESNAIRGLLHWHCNAMVGVFENESSSVVQNIVKYLDDAIVRTQGNNNFEKPAEMTGSVSSDTP